MESLGERKLFFVFCCVFVVHTHYALTHLNNYSTCMGKIVIPQWKTTGKALFIGSKGAHGEVFQFAFW